MMKNFVLTFCIGCTFAMPASAAPTIEEIIAQLEAQGYSDVSVSRTWLGRIRIEAESGTHEREIVFNQRTGEILRDFWEELDDEQDEHDGGDGDGGAPEDSGEEAEEEDSGGAQDDSADGGDEDTDAGADQDEKDSDDSGNEGDDEEGDEGEDDS